jgi:phage terminase large subunit-like protein
MINVNVFQYNREIEVVCVDSVGTAAMTPYLGNMPMYDGHHKLHKGIDNTLRFKIKDTDRKPIDLTGKTIIWKMYDRESRENVLFRFADITNATKGQATLSISTADTIMLPEGFYQFAMYTVEDGVEQIIYTDTYDNAKGTIEVIDDIYPQFEDSQETTTFFPSTFEENGETIVKYTTTTFDGSGNTVKSKSLHTIALYFDGMTGTVNIQGDLSVQPSLNDNDWFDLTPQLFYDNDITVNNETGVQAYMVNANVNWIRIRYTATSGSITKVMIRN